MCVPSLLNFIHGPDMTAFLRPPATLVKKHATRHTCGMCGDVDLSRPPPPGSLAERAFALADEALRPLPGAIALRRRQLEQPFAVLLMRSGYNAVDALDIVGMDEFQRTFFDIRSRAWQRYRLDNNGVRQGSLDDPRYFDFISYAQMLTTHRFIRTPRAVFTEAYSDEDGRFASRIVRRDSPSTCIQVLRRFRLESGQRILDSLGVAKSDDPLDALALVYAAFDKNGFCLRADVGSAAGECDVELVAPATLWSERALRVRKAIANEYDVWTGLALLRSHGWTARVSTQFTGNSIRRRWQVMRRSTEGI